MGRKRNRQRHPTVGGVVGEDTTKQGRRRRAKRDVAEMARVVRKGLKMPTTKEVQDVGRTKEG